MLAGRSQTSLVVRGSAKANAKAKASTGLRDQSSAGGTEIWKQV